MHQQRPWEALPNLALSNIFRRTSIKDRSHHIPFVCRSWAHAARDPHCWASMVAQIHSPFEDPAADRAFVLESRDYDANFVDPYDGRRSPNPHRGVASLQGLIARSGGGAAVTSIYFFPFLASSVALANNDDAILRCISKYCSNLKHISFHGSYNASQEAVLELIRRCSKLELVDFSDSPYFNPLILGELSICCPKIRGIRMSGIFEPSFSNGLGSRFPCLRLLNISYTTVVDKDLIQIVDGCKELCYLDITGCQGLVYYMHIIKVASAKIAKIVYD